MDERLAKAMEEIQRQKEDHGVDIHGKLYSLVQDRIEVFRRTFGTEYGIDTKVDYSEGFGRGAVVVATAKIISASGITVASGHACEFVGSSRFTSHSPVEVAETSAIGRALASFGLHGGEYASGDEVGAAVRKEHFQKMVGPVERQGNSSDHDGGYDDHDTAWADTTFSAEEVLERIDGIQSAHELHRYWDDIKPMLKKIGKEEPRLQAEIKASFAQRNGVLGGRK
jgi:hypothetical protein